MDDLERFKNLTLKLSKGKLTEAQALEIARERQREHGLVDCPACGNIARWAQMVPGAIVCDYEGRIR
jgi:hypothetical protein